MATFIIYAADGPGQPVLADTVTVLAPLVFLFDGEREVAMCHLDHFNRIVMVGNESVVPNSPPPESMHSYELVDRRIEPDLFDKEDGCDPFRPE
jgi:hypothetical protein